MKKLLILLVLAATVLSLGACRNADDAGGIVEVTIPHYKTGDNVGALYFLPIVERFNERYEGRFRLNIEPMPQHLYAEQIRLLAGTPAMPVLIEGGLDDVWFRDVIIPNNMFVDLRPFFRTHEIYRYFNQQNYQHNLTADGRLITVPHPIQRPMTMYYNEALWQPSRPIAQLSWRDVTAELGDNRVAFMTAENAWTTMLALSSMIAAEPGGADIVRNAVATQTRIRDFNQPPLVAAFATLQHVFANHAQPGAIGAPFAEAANAFFNLNAAIICNGPWMVGDFRYPDGAHNWGPGFDHNTVRMSVLPGNVALQNPLGFNWWIPATASEAEQELALHFLGFMFSHAEMEFTMAVAGGVIPGFQHSADFLRERAEDRLMDEYAASIDANTIIMPAFWDAVYSSIADRDFGTLLPQLVDGTLTPQQFADELTRLTLEAVS
ncbi:MAG: ABC transporter substrate-binding protein [Defluviitaleaceae bacterium]|nr:ABC transporter substrate-binding protein [Defluviitaleaceae bacterium]MCL2238885.1 ABC transporter substrate-binding protein [Defluviitaleaceae bacterium]